MGLPANGALVAAFVNIRGAGEGGRIDAIAEDPP
jgi:hypothetical protein